MNPAFNPEEDYNESMSYTDPRGAAKFRHYAKHTNQYEVEVKEPEPHYWLVPVICGISALMVLFAFRA